MGLWHISWQDLVQAEAVEVVIGQHRADIVGNDGVVVELQHSNISTEDIAVREDFYGDMIWLFDATERFALLSSKCLGFFSLNRTEHVTRCSKQVFLDFGSVIVEVLRFTEDVPFFHGYGKLRDRRWFSDRFLSDVLHPGAKLGTSKILPNGIVERFTGKSSIERAPHRVRWVNQETGETEETSSGDPLIGLGYEIVNRRTGDRRPVWSDIIAKCPEIARGWDVSSFKTLLTFFDGKPVILNGGLTMLPSPAGEIKVDMPVSSVEHLLSEVDRHIREGRFPILKDQTKQTLIKKAGEYEMATYGKRLIRPTEQPREKIWFEN